MPYPRPHRALLTLAACWVAGSLACANRGMQAPIDELGGGGTVTDASIDAASTGVYLHGFSGDLLREEMGDTGLAASDLAERLPRAIRALSSSRA